MKTCIDLFSGLGGFSAAFAESDKWKVIKVDQDRQFEADMHRDVRTLNWDALPQPDVILASPPCQAFSMAASGTHLDSEGNPKTAWGRTSLEVLHHTIGLIKALNPEWWFLENPRGGMRRELGEPEGTVWYCQYGKPYAKPTDLWGNHPPSMEYRSCTNENPYCDHERSPRGAPTGTQNDDYSTKERSEVPYELSQSILNAVENPESPQSEIHEW